MLTLQTLGYQSECLFFSDRIKQGNWFDVILLYSEGVSFTEVQESPVFSGEYIMSQCFG